MANRGANRTKKRGLDGLRARALAKFGFVAPLKTSVLLTRGAGAASFTRATAATVKDFEGKIRNCVSGEVRFEGQRRVRNLLTNTVLTGGATPTGWSRIAAGGTVEAVDSAYVTGHKALRFTVTNDREIAAITVTLEAGKTYLPSVLVEAVSTSSSVQTSLQVVAVTATITGLPLGYTTQAVAGKRLTCPTLTCTGAGTVTFRIGLGCGALETGSGDITISCPQLEDITGQANQNPSEYVSVGAAKLNELVQTEDFSLTWVKANLTVTSDAIAAPFGGFADKAVETAVNAVHELTQAFTTLSTTDAYSLSVYAKAGERNWLALWLDGTAKGAYFDVANGVVGTTSAGVTAAIVPAGEPGWYRCAISVTPTAAASTFGIYLASGDGSASYLGDTTKGLYLFGAHFKKTAVLPDYFPVGNVFPFHGACVDGVKYFDTQNGNTVASNVVTEGTGAAIDQTSVGYLPESASTNLVLQSSNFASATWTKVGTPTISSAAKYCGDIALDLLGDDDAGVLERCSQGITFTGNGTKSFSAVVSQGSSTSSVLLVYDATALANRGRCVITWSNGVPVLDFTTGGSQERPPEALGNGCYRIFGLASGVIAANANVFYVDPANTVGGAVANTGNIYVGGVQAENATVASSLIPTTTATATRNADALSYAGVGNISQTTGSIYAEVTPKITAGAEQGIVEIGDGTANERITLHRSTAGNATLDVVDGGVSQASINAGAMALSTEYQVAAQYAANDFAAVLDGGTVGADTGGTLPTTTTIYVGSERGTLQAGGPVKNIRIAKVALSDAELRAITR